MNLNKLLFKRVDNSPLIVFRILFGLLLFLESFGAILTGWIKRTLIDPQFTFSFIGLEWLQPLPGNGMYYYYAVMSIFGLLVMLGYKYRVSIIIYTIMWSGVYFMQKASYNNHYYLLILICGIMCFLPANSYMSLDARNNPGIKRDYMPNWVIVIIVLQLFIVYTYASVAKLYPDWLDTTVAKNLMAARSHYYIIGDIIQEKWFHHFLTYSGILFDLLVVPLLLWKPTRNFAFIASILFHLFNSIVFQIGIFPYLSLAFILFFYEPKTVQRIFLKKKSFYNDDEVVVPTYRKPLLTVASIYFIIQILLPLRHWVIKDDVLWTEEGHRLSWRMMLRSKQGKTIYTVVDNETNEKRIIKLSDYLSPKQQRIASTKPDIMWQFSQRLKKEYAAKGIDISVYINARLSVNGRPYKKFINSEVDIAAQPWDYFKHSDWILPSE